MKPTIGRIVHYRGNRGYNALRPAMVVVDSATLDPRGVEDGVIDPLDSDEHVHLWVFSADPNGGFVEFNVGRTQASDGEIEPGTWDWPRRS